MLLRDTHPICLILMFSFRYLSPSLLAGATSIYPNREIPLQYQLLGSVSAQASLNMDGIDTYYRLLINGRFRKDKRARVEFFASHHPTPKSN